MKLLLVMAYFRKILFSIAASLYQAHFNLMQMHLAYDVFEKKRNTITEHPVILPGKLAQL